MNSQANQRNGKTARQSEKPARTGNRKPAKTEAPRRDAEPISADDYSLSIESRHLNSLFAEIEATFDDRGLPHNRKMEQEALCAILLGDPQFTSISFSVLEPADFWNPVYAAIFECFRGAWAHGVPFNSPGTLVQWMGDSKLVARLRKMTGMDALNFDVLLELMQSNGLAINAEYYAITLRKLRTQREIWLLLFDAMQDAKHLPPLGWLEKYRDRIVAMLPPGT